MKKFYFLFLLFSFSFANGMEAPEDYSEQIFNSEFQNYVIDRVNLKFPTVCDDFTVQWLCERVTSIIDSRPNKFNSIIIDCLLGPKGLLNPSTVKRMSPRSKALVLTKFYDAILQADIQTKCYLLDYFSNAKLGSLKNDHSCLEAVHALLSELEASYKSVFAYFQEKIRAAIEQRENWFLLPTIIENNHNKLIEFIRDIDNVIIKEFYKARVIQTYCSASEKLEKLNFIDEALNILEKARLFNDTQYRSLESKISELENRLRNTVIYRMDDDDQRMVDQNYGDGLQLFMQYPNPIEELDFSIIPSQSTAPAVTDLTEDFSFEMRDLTHGTYEEPEENTAFQTVYKQLVKFIQSGQFQAANSYLFSLLRDGGIFTTVDLQEFATMREFLNYYILLDKLSKNPLILPIAFMNKAEIYFKRLRKNTSERFYPIYSMLMNNALYTYCTPRLLSENKLTLPAVRLLKIYVKLINFELKHGNYVAAKRRLDYIFTKICDSSNNYSVEWKHTDKYLRELCELRFQGWYDTSFDESNRILQEKIDAQDWDGLTSEFIELSIKFKAFISKINYLKLKNCCLEKFFTIYTYVLKTLKENSLENYILRIISNNPLFNDYNFNLSSFLSQNIAQTVIDLTEEDSSFEMRDSMHGN